MQRQEKKRAENERKQYWEEWWKEEEEEVVVTVVVVVGGEAGRGWGWRRKKRGEEQGVMRLQKGLIPQLIGGAVAVEVRPSRDYH